MIFLLIFVQIFRDYFEKLLFIYLKLNEFIRLEYRNPASIKLKFNCNKENMEFELGCSRETQHKMHELVIFNSFYQYYKYYRSRNLFR